MKNKKYLYFGLIACLALLFVVQSNSYATDQNRVDKGVRVVDGIDDDGPGRQIDLPEDDSSKPVVDKRDGIADRDAPGRLTFEVDYKSYYFYYRVLKSLFYRYSF